MDRDTLDLQLRKFQRELSAGTVSLVLLSVLGQASEVPSQRVHEQGL